MGLQLKGKMPPCDAVIMETLSAEYGWLPSQIRNEKRDDIQDYLQILNTRRDIENKELKKHKK